MKELREQDKWGLGKPKVMIFDVNETLIDFQSLNPLFKKTFGDEKGRRLPPGHAHELPAPDVWRQEPAGARRHRGALRKTVLYSGGEGL